MNKELNEAVAKELMMSTRFLRHQNNRPRGQQHILRILNDYGPINQKDLQEELHVMPGSISEIVSKLEAKGYLTKTKSEEDSRAIVLNITEEGKKFISGDSEDLNIFEAISEDELVQLKEILTKLNNDWLRKQPVEGFDRKRRPMGPNGHRHHHHHMSPRGFRHMMCVNPNETER